MALPTVSDLLNMGIHEASIDWTWFTVIFGGGLLML